MAHQKPSPGSRLVVPLIIVMAAVLLGTLGFLALRAQQPYQPGVGILPEDATPLIPPTLKGVGAWYKLQMSDTQTGWIAAQSGILHTSDGGAHWIPVLQCGSQNNDGGCIISFDSATSATLSTPIHNTRQQIVGARIYHTTDGGQHWQYTIIPAIPIQPARFVDDEHGWTVATTGPNTLALFRTIDGGRSWQQLKPGPKIKTATDLTFQNATNGWIINTDTATPGQSNIIQTRDGGQTWQPISVPGSKTPGNAVLTFLNSHQGFFLNSVTTASKPETSIYNTTDGGTTWHTQGHAAFYLQPSDFMDLQHIWTRSSDPNEKALYTSSDGGANWRKIPLQSAPFKILLSYSFVSPQLGFALGSQVQYPTTGESTLYKTSDGGQSWQKVA